MSAAELSINERHLGTQLFVTILVVPGKFRNVACLFIINVSSCVINQKFYDL